MHTARPILATTSDNALNPSPKRPPASTTSIETEKKHPITPTSDPRMPLDTPPLSPLLVGGIHVAGTPAMKVLGSFAARGAGTEREM